ncbi:class III lanthionine synthetase LanKC [Hyalangium minutum]|uniref:Protein kinase domain-containing protein n=1 Tax=Hyalangium minutum TaxID=394096 RepID=A0A085W8M4_9BACT|nr:class III lanthionine synthetase LanKC [Hyalangium minutum]KFE64037.1 hypothetical protein DB31_2450 [Hyalangium minutum]
MREFTGFIIVDPERYESLDRYRSTQSDYRGLVSLLLPTGWTLSDEPGVWCGAAPEGGVIPAQGFKIHISAIHEHAPTILRTILPILTEERVPFKFLVDEQMLGYMSSSDCPGSSCGKFITIYPSDVRHFVRMMERLHAVTAGFAGPYILSDKRYRGSKVLFYRYGAFKAQGRVDIFGERVYHIQGADGSCVSDQRQPFFFLPNGVADPFPDDPEPEPSEVVLKGRYRITGVLAQSSKGGVYLAVDLETGAELVVKEGRRFINRTAASPHDAVACLANEYRVLKILEDTGLTPRPYDFFEEWEHSFIVMERIQGKRSLISYRASSDSPLALISNPSWQDVIDYCTRFVDIARNLTDALRKIHDLGVVVHDLAPQNILLDPTTRTVSFVDFESAHCTAGGQDGLIVPLQTPGFGGPSALRGEKPTVEEDYQALSGVLCDLIFPVTSFFTINPQSRRRLYSRIAREKGIPGEVLALALDIGESPSSADALLESARRSIAAVRPPEPLPPAAKAHELSAAVEKIAEYAVWALEKPRRLDPPTDYRRFITNDLNISYGVAGIALFLHRVKGDLPPSVRGGLLELSETAGIRDYPPGLHIGLAGIALAFHEIGLKERAKALMAMANASPILHDNLDVFYGTAGVGLANLWFFHVTKREEYLDQAAALSSRLKAGLQKTGDGYCYPSSDGITYHGYAHGAAGIAQFFLKLYQCTGEPEHLELARGLLDFEMAHARGADDSLIWQRSRDENVVSPYSHIGSAGIGCVLLDFHRVLGEPRDLAAARKIARHLYGKYSAFPGRFAGMAGLGDFFIDMHQHTGEVHYREEAHRFAERIMLFAIEKEHGIVFPGEELVRISTDLGTGSAGIGIFFDRLVRDGDRLLGDF